MKIKKLVIPFEELEWRNQDTIKRILELRKERKELMLGFGYAIGTTTGVSAFLNEMIKLPKLTPVVFASLAFGANMAKQRFAGEETKGISELTELVGRFAKVGVFLHPKFEKNYDVRKILADYTHVCIDRKGNLIFVREPKKGFFRKLFYGAKTPFVRKRASIRQKPLPKPKIKGRRL